MSDHSPYDDRMAERLRRLRDDVTPEFAPLGPAAARATVRRRRTVLAVAVVALVVAAGAGAAFAVAGGPDRLVPADPPPASPTPTTARSAPTPSRSLSPTPSPTASASSGPPVGTVDWSRATLALPALDGCPAGTRTFAAGRSDDRSGPTDDEYPVWTLTAPARSAYGDLDGDGADDALVRVACEYGSSSTVVVVGVRRRTDGSLRTLGPVTFADASHAEAVTSVGVTGGRAVIGLARSSTGSRQTRTFRFDGTRFVRVGGPAAFPVRLRDLAWANVTLTVGSGGGCRGGTYAFRGSAAAEPGGGTYRLGEDYASQTFADLDGDGVEEAAFRVWCRRSDGTTTVGAMVVGVGADGKPAALGTIFSASNDVKTLAVRGGGVVLTLGPAAGPADEQRVYDVRDGRLVQVSGPTG